MLAAAHVVVMTTAFESQHPRVTDGTFTDKTQSAPELELAARNPDDVFTARKGSRPGHHSIESEQTNPSPVGGRYLIRIGGQPSVNTRVGGALRLYSSDEREAAHRKALDLAKAGSPMTLLVDRGNSIQAIEARGSIGADGSAIAFLKGSKSKYYPLDSLKLIGVESGYGKQDKLAAAFDARAAVVPVTEPATFDGIPEYEDGIGPEDGETVAAVFLIDGPDFGNGREPGCMFFATDIQREEAPNTGHSIVNGYFWAPDDAGLLTSESGSFYTKDLEVKAGRVRDYVPGSITYRETWAIPADRAAGYAVVNGKQ